VSSAWVRRNGHKLKCTKFHLNIEKPWTGHPARVWSHQGWGYSIPNWTWSRAACFRRCCLSRGLDQITSRRVPSNLNRAAILPQLGKY